MGQRGFDEGRRPNRFRGLSLNDGTILQSGASYLSQGFEDMFWEVPRADWLILYSVGRQVE